MACNDGIRRETMLLLFIGFRSVGASWRDDGDFTVVEWTGSAKRGTRPSPFAGRLDGCINVIGMRLLYLSPRNLLVVSCMKLIP